jgi:acyl-CoA synthetase (AMP-forming)/AMP-acid ligase II
MNHPLENFPLVPGITITDDGVDSPRSYANEDIDKRINAVAKGLLELRLPPNSAIAVLGTVTYDFITMNIGISRARHAVVPVNYKIPKEQVEFCVRDSGAVIAFCDAELRHLVPDNIKCIAFESKEFEQFLKYGNYDIPEYNPDYVHSIMYTSGTTGNPKGVVTTYQARIIQVSKGLLTPIPHPNKNSRLVLINPSPLYHLAGKNNVEVEIFFSGFKEIHLVLMPVFNAKKYIVAIKKYSPTRITLIAPMMSMILQEKELLSSVDTSAVGKIVLTSSHAPRKLQEEIMRYFKNVRVIENPYGMTETGPLFSQAHPLNIPKPTMSVGYPLPMVEARLDSDGVLQVKSPTILANYHNRPDLFNNSMTKDGFFITGDIFTVNKYGFYFYQGRADDMFKSGGEKIYPSEIEPIVERHPDVALSSIVGLPDEIKGNKPYAFVELRPKCNTTAEQIKDFIVKNVATYQIPRHVWILDQLPRTNIGKIDKRKLVEMAKELLLTQKQ